jgi:hypothetical protein
MCPTIPIGASYLTSAAMAQPAPGASALTADQLLAVQQAITAALDSAKANLAAGASAADTDAAYAAAFQTVMAAQISQYGSADASAIAEVAITVGSTYAGVTPTALGTGMADAALALAQTDLTDAEAISTAMANTAPSGALEAYNTTARAGGALGTQIADATTTGIEIGSNRPGAPSNSTGFLFTNNPAINRRTCSGTSCN